jgi:tRNA pseudouridine13 synthase
MLIKHVPEDFIVEEVPLREWNDDGAFVVFKLTKISLNTEQAVEIIGRRFHIPTSDIKYSGTKDKHAHTMQYISIPNRHGVSQIRLDEDNLKLEHVGFSDEPLSLGTLTGNRFILTVRELEHKELSALKSKISKKKTDSNILIIPNYFDEQRFSSNNYNIGRSIMKREYKKAVEYMCESSDIYADTVVIYLAAHPNDYVGALQRIPKKTLMMFIHAVQSFIFNEALSRILLEHAVTKNIKHYIVPYSAGNFVFYEDFKDYESISDSLEMVGFNTSNMNHHVKYVMTELSITQRDFIIRALPEISVDGTTRQGFIEVQNLDVRIMDDRTILEFELPKGSYATIVVKMMFN